MSALEHYRDQLGFDKTEHVRGTKRYHIGCSRCAPMIINGTATHEIGCPNALRTRYHDEDNDES